MKQLYQLLLKRFAHETLVEFDYRDTTGMHHGHCYIRSLFVNRQRMMRMMHSLGYTNIHIA